MRTCFLFLLFLFPVVLNAQVPERSTPPKLVNDLAEILSPQEEAALEQKLVALDDTTGNQIVVLTLNDMGGYQPWEFGHMVIEQWGVGQKDRSNGVVVLVKPKTPSENGQLHISVGYGLEGVIPDAVANQVSDDEMIPLFKEGKYFEGIDKGTSILASLAAGEFSAAEYQKKRSEKGPGISPIIIFLIIAVVLSFLRRRGTKNHKSIGKGVPGLAWWILASQMGKRHSGSWGDFSGGSGPFSGGGGGGFGGFGGGSSGGGGAGGSW